MRYSGQEFSLPVPVSAEHIDQQNVEAMCESFNDLHDRRYGYHASDQPLEIVNIRLIASSKRKQLESPAPGLKGGEDPLIGERMVYLDDEKACAIYRRDKLAPGSHVIGPAIIQEYGCTTVLFPGDMATVAETGELIINIGEANDEHE